MKSKTNLFVAFTPYHVLLMWSIALRFHDARNLLFIVSEFPEADLLARSLAKSHRKVFESVVLLPGAHKRRNVFVKLLLRRKNAGLLQNLIEKESVDAVFIGNDERVEAQAALHFAKEKNAACEGIYVEDGSVAYPFAVEKKSRLTALFQKLVFGFWRQENDVPGTTPWIGKVAAIFPELLRDELKNKKIAPIRKEDFLSMRKEPAFQEYLRSLHIPLEKLESLDALFMAAHSENEGAYPQYAGIMNGILELLLQKHWKIALKYHPRELSGDFLKVEKRDVVVLPSAFPLELLYVLLERPPRLILGGVSTALLTAQWLLSDRTRVVSLANLYDYKDQAILGTLEKTGVRLLRDKEEFKGLLKSFA